jgi:hypothetical protein
VAVVETVEGPALDSSEITAAVVHQLFPPRKWAVCPNVSWGLLPWEADILALSANDVIHEVEVKVTLSDLKRDLLKDKWGRRAPGDPPFQGNLNPRWDARLHIHRFWYAVPEGLREAAETAAEAIGGGVIVCRRVKQSSAWPGCSVAVEKVKQPKEWQGPTYTWSAEKWRQQLNRLCALRYWDMMKSGRMGDVFMALRRSINGLPAGDLKEKMLDFQRRYCPSEILREEENP